LLKIKYMEYLLVILKVNLFLGLSVEMYNIYESWPW
jgi:hypothetical protein